MDKKTRRLLSGLPRRFGAGLMSAAMILGSVYTGSITASAAETTDFWKQDVLSALDALEEAQTGGDAYTQATEALQNAYDSLQGARSVENLTVTAVTADTITLEWSAFESDDLLGYNVYWADSNTETTQFQLLDKDSNNLYDAAGMTIDINDIDAAAPTVTFVVKMSTNMNHWFCVAPVTSVGPGSKCEPVMSPTAVAYETQLENIGRGLTVTATAGGAYLNWRLLGSELDGGYTETGLTGLNFNIYRDGEKIATVTDSTNYLDTGFTGTLTDSTYRLVPVNSEGVEQGDLACSAYDIFTADSANTNAAYIDIPLQKPADTTFRETYGIDHMALTGYNWAADGYGATNVDSTITYSANDMSVADVDGDGEYEYILEWDPSFSKDVSQQGYTGKQYIDCYELDGTLLWRLDLGINIRAGAHYTEFGVYDFDGDGKAEMMVKTAPGSSMTKYALDENGRNIMENGSPKIASIDYVSIPADDAAAGVTNSSNYVFSAEDYREYLIDVFQDWGVWSRYSEKTVKDAIEGHWSNNLVEMLSTDKRWSDATFYHGDAANTKGNLNSMSTADIQALLPAYKEGDRLVNVALYNGDEVKFMGSSGRQDANMKTVLVGDVKDYYGGYDLASVDKDVTGVGYTREEATLLADYFLKHYQYRMQKHHLTVYEGYIITGPEYITLFDCSNGAELDTQDWYYEREDDGMLWGDYAMNFMEPGNRCDRFNVVVAYLDGSTPSCVMGRGYYTRTTMVAYNVVDKKLQVAGKIDSGWTVMTNPFNDGPHGYDGCDPVNGTLSGQGDHYIAVADVDGDGRQEIVNGGAIVSYKDGDLYLYSSGKAINTNDPSKGLLKYGHGDAIHITDIDPDHPGLEIVSCFEGGAWAPYNWAMRDAKSNTPLFGEPGASDFGRIMIGDVLPDVPGIEISTGYDAKGNRVSLSMGTNMSIKWAANMTTQLVSGSRGDDISIVGGGDGKTTFLKAAGYRTNNDTKGNPCLVADLFGDSREEMILRKEDSSSLRIYMNTEVSTHKNYTLMHNAHYRVGVASQNSSYNQPAYTDYYYASDTDWSRVLIPNTPSDQEPGPVIAEPVNVNLNSTSETLKAGETFQLSATVVPSSADQTVTWTSADDQVATVDANGLVTGVRRGVARITATTKNGKECSCTFTVIGGYKPDGLDTMPVGTTLDFIFGSGAESTETKTAVKGDTLYYSDETGYGFAPVTNVTLTEGADYVAGNNYRSTDATPVYEYPTFQVKVPVGVYEVTLVQGTDGASRAVNGAYVEGNKYSVRWSSQAFATSFTEPTEDSWLYTEAGETKTTTLDTAVADGQLTINLATSLTDAGVSGTTYIKEIIVTRKEQITEPSETPTLRFIGDSTLAKYPPEDGGTWTPIPERTGWGEDFSMGRFVDDSLVLVNKAVAGSSIKSYIYDGYLNDFLLNSHPGDTVIIEGGINDSAAGPRASTAAEFKEKLAYVIDCCEAFGLDVIVSSGTSSQTTYTDPMKELAAERELHYVDLLTKWTEYQTAAGTTQGNMTVDGTHLRRVGAIVAAQLVANDIADLDGLYISGHVRKTTVNLEAPTATVTGLFVKAQTEGSLTLSWNLDEATLYDPKQLITDFNIYSVGSDGKATKIAAQTAYISAGMDGPQMQATFPAEAAGNYYVTTVGLTGEGPASATLKVGAFAPSDSYTLSKLIETFGKQLHDASPYKVASYAAVKTALAEGGKVLANPEATAEEIKAALDKAQAAVAALELNATEFMKEDFQKTPLGTAPWGVSGGHSSLMAAEMQEDGNRLLNLYVEAAGGREVKKEFADTTAAALEMVEFEWYPGNPDRRNVTEVEFLGGAQRVLSLKSSSNGHIGYVVGNYPEGNDYKIGDGFHAYAGSKATDLNLTNEAWYNVKVVFDFTNHTADLYIAPRDDDSLEGAVVKDIAIDQASNTITTMNFRLERGRTDGDAGNDLSILWDMYMDDYGMYYGAAPNTVDAAKVTAYENAKAAYLEKIAGLGADALSGEQFVLAQAVMDIMLQDVGFFTDADYEYAESVLKEATDAAPDLVKITSLKVTTEQESLTAGLSTGALAETNKGANEEILWESSDESIAKVEGTGTKAVVTAYKAGTVTITAKGALSGTSGSAELTVTGEAFFFNKDTASDGAYSAEKGHGFMNYTYPEEAKGWTAGISPDGNVYVKRELSEEAGTAYLKGSESGADYVAVYGQNWTEMPEGGRDEDKVPYQNTSAFVVDRENGNYVVSATFVNPGQSPVEVQVIPENIVRYDVNDFGSELATITVAPGQTASVSFPLALTDGQINLRFVQKTADGSYETAAKRNVYVQSVSVDDYRAEDRAKTAVLIAGDSTVQSYSDKAYRTSWAQLLYNYFGKPVKDGVNDGENKGFATYETEDTYLVNYARDARSTKSFLEEGRLNALLLNVQEGDYVLMQFAHNDDNQARANRFVSLADFEENIKAYDAAIKERGGTLVLVTPIALGVWENGVLDHRFDDYRQVMLESGLPVIDLMGATLELLSAVGENNCNNVLKMYKDTVHTFESGATMYSRLMSNLLLDSDDERIASLKALMDVEKKGSITLIGPDKALYINDTDSVVAVSDRTDADGEIIWLSSNDKIVSVDADGKLTAGDKKGTAIITAGYATGDMATTDATAYSAYILVSVTDVPYPGEVEVDTEGGVSISGSKEEIADKVLTEEEKTSVANGVDIDIILTKEEISEDAIDSATMAKIGEAIVEFSKTLAAGIDLQPGTYLDITLKVKVGDNEPREVENLNPGQMISLTIEVPEKDRLTAADMENITRTYKVLRVHGTGDTAETDVLDAAYDETTHELTFDTDRFSYYLLAYYDTAKGSEPTPTPGQPGEPTPTPDVPGPTPDSPDVPGDNGGQDDKDGDDNDNSASDSGYVKSPKTYDEHVTIDTENLDVPGCMPQAMEGYKFDFGSKGGTAEGYVNVDAKVLYNADTGYGWTENTPVDSIDYSRFSTDYVDDTVDPAFLQAFNDMLAVAGADLEFAIDLPAGTYRVDLAGIHWQAGNNWFAHNKLYINGIDLGYAQTDEAGNHIPDGFETNGIMTGVKSCKVTLTEPGQIVVMARNEDSGKSAALDVITVSEYVERTDAFSAPEWDILNEKALMLRTKAGFFEDDSTPLDYDVILVNRMTETLDALEAVMYMDSIADTTVGDELYAKCEEAVKNKVLYTEASMAKLEAAMADYQTAKDALDIRDVVRDAYEVIDFWLLGVTREYEVTPYAGYFDFNTTQTGGSKYDDTLVWEAPGWTPVGAVAGHPEFTAYSEELGYGLLGEGYQGRHRGTGDPVRDDVIFNAVFQVDLPAGTYNVVTYTGDMLATAKGASGYYFYTGYDETNKTGTLIAEQDCVTAAAGTCLERTSTFTLAEATTVTMVAYNPNTGSKGQQLDGYTNAVVIEQYVKAEVETFPIDELVTLKNTIDAANLQETDYTISTWSAFKAAYDKAAAAIERGTLLMQEGEAVKTNLDETFKALKERVATGQLFLDFGPAQESDEVPGQVAPNILLDGKPGVVLAEGAANLLSTGADLYASTMDDNGIHYGFDRVVNDGFTASGGPYFRDFVYSPGGAEYTFKADVPVGQYLVYVYTGCKEAANVTKFFFNDGEAAAASTNTAVVEKDGKTIYTQQSNSGGQFADPGCVYTVNITENAGALSTIKGTKMGTLSLTLFNDESTVAEEITARFNGIALARIGDAGEVQKPELPSRELYNPDEWTFGEVLKKFDIGGRRDEKEADLPQAEGYTFVKTDAYSAKTGYGFTNADGINYNGVGVTCDDASADQSLVAACCDLAWRTGELTFAVDMPAGSYLVELYAGASNATADAFKNATFTINGQTFESKAGSQQGQTPADFRFAAVVTLDADGQITVSANHDGQRAFMNALVITEATAKGAAKAPAKAPAVTPEPVATPEATATPEPTATPEATATPEPTATPEATATPEPVATPEPAVVPDVTEGNEATENPDETEESGQAEDPDAAEESGSAE